MVMSYSQLYQNSNFTNETFSYYQSKIHTNGNDYGRWYTTSHRVKAEHWTNTTQSNKVRPTTWGKLTLFPKTSSNDQSWKYRAYTYSQSVPYTHTFGGCSLLGGDISSNSCTFALSANHINRVNSQCLSKFGDGHINLGVAMAELGETAGFIASTTSSVLKFARGIKRGNVNDMKHLIGGLKPKDLPNTASDRWLAYNYAVRPLISDVAGAANLFNKGLDASKFITKRSSVKARYSDSDTETAYQTHETTGDYTYRSQITAEVVDSQLQALKLLGLTNPAEIVWELIPFSFVIDWALPIGTWLQALNATLGLKFVKGHVSVRLKGTQISKPKEDVDLPTSSGRFDGYYRWALSDFPTPLPYYKSPFSNSHGATVLALLNNLRR